MSSVVAAIFKSTVGLLVTKARDKTAKSLQDGDVADQAFRNLIVREIDDIKTKLSGLARKDLLASTEHFKSGILNLNQVFEKSFVCPNETSEGAAAEAAAVENTSTLATLHVAKQIQNLQLTDLNESAKTSLADAKGRFESARKKAIDAFSNEALSTSDRILALKIQLMATILERVDRPADALDDSRLCLENLHAMPAVRENFKVQLTGGVRSVFNKKEREAIIVSVCQVNEVVFRVTQIIKGGTFAGQTVRLPCLQVNDESIDVLRDARVVKKLIELDLSELCAVGFWSFDLDFKPNLIATNTRDQTFIVTDHRKIKVYDPSGRFLYTVKYPCGRFLYTVKYPDKVNISVQAIATDRDGNLYAILKLSESWHVYVWDQYGHFQHSYLLLPPSFSCFVSLTINDNNHAFVLTEHVKVYNTQGTFLREFGEEILTWPEDITAASDGRVMVLDMSYSSLRVHTFSADGDHLQQFTPAAPHLRARDNKNRFIVGFIAFDRSSEVVVIFLNNCEAKVLIYTKDGEFLHKVPALGVWTTECLLHQNVAVTADGCLAVISDDTVRVGKWENLAFI